MVEEIAEQPNFVQVALTTKKRKVEKDESPTIDSPTVDAPTWRSHRIRYRLPMKKSVEVVVSIESPEREHGGEKENQPQGSQGYEGLKNLASIAEKLIEKNDKGLKP